jgi:hypothetical protein
MYKVLRVRRVVRRVGVKGSDSVVSGWRKLRSGIVNLEEESVVVFNYRDLLDG